MSIIIIVRLHFLFDFAQIHPDQNIADFGGEYV